MAMARPFKVKAGDEVCMLVEEELVFGTAEYLKIDENESSGSSKGQVWKVRWINDPSQTVPCEVQESKLLPTDRPIEKSSKVRMIVKEGDKEIIKEGICRSVIHHADLRILGTNTIIPEVNIDEFSHLKRYTQKSVVHYKGWLGVVVSVDRKVELHQTDDTETTNNLNSVIPTGTLKIESHAINEQVDNLSRPIESPKVQGGPQKHDPIDEYTAWKRARRIGFVKDLTVESVKVQWIHQIDPEFPDKPKQEFKDNAINDLQIIKENVSVDDMGFSFEVGNIGRYAITSQTEYQRWDDWQRRFAANHLPREIQPKLQTAFNYERCMKNKYWRVYDYNLMNHDEKSQDKQGLLKLGQELVVEISHICTIPTILWKDNTYEIPKSSLDLDVIEDFYLSDAEMPRPGDFITSKYLAYRPDQVYCVVLRQEYDKNGASQLCVKVLDCEVSAKIIETEAIIKGDLLLSAGFVERHPVFQYFNETTTIVVINEVTSVGQRIRIGNVIGTNLLGKVNVKFLESGGTRKEEWVWPQQCAIYSVKGYDLECVKSHITDTNSEIESEAKLQNIIEMLETKVDLVWKNSSKSEQDLERSLSELTYIIGSFRDLVNRMKCSITMLQHYDSLTSYLSRPIGLEKSSRPSYFKENPELCKLVLTVTQECMSQGKRVLESIQKNNCNGDIEMVDLSSLPVDPMSNLFAETVRVLDSHPEGHHFAKSTQYNPGNNKLFTKTVKQELDGLKKICSTETKSQMGILSRVFADRMDLLSFLMRGPEGTPYENSIYIFDAHLPPQYPNEPPRFHFHAFKAGRLNPNLYAEGKVCVSLLGTWAGKDEREKWTKDSNLVQILISIQGLILVAEPFHNEPGFETDKFDSRTARANCHTYNVTLMPLVIQMMMNQIEFGMEPWTEIINAFYKIQVPIFLERWNRWLAAKNEKELGNDAPHFSIFPFSATFKKTMRKELDRLDKTWKKKLLDKQ